MKLLLSALSIILINISLAYGQTALKQTKDSANVIEWQTLTVDKFEIEHPIDWEVDKSQQMGTTFLILSPMENEKDQFRENVNVLTQDLSAYNLSLDQYTNITLEQVKTMITESEILLSERKKNDNGEYHQLIYKGKQGVYDLQFQQYFWLLDNEAIILTFTGEQTQYDKYLKIAETILNSFAIN